jgi:hypothetical protein
MISGCYELLVMVNKYRILLCIVRAFFKENYEEILLAHYTWKVVEKGLKIKWVMWC